MTFPMTNSSPYGQQKQFQLSPSGGTQGNSSSGGLWQSLFGRPERNYQQSTLGPNQQPVLNNLLGSIGGQGAGGAFGDAADYYRSLLGNSDEDFNAFAAPELRRFRQDILPEIGEQFSGYGGNTSSGFRNASIQAGTDLSERLASMRANLRGQGAEGLRNIGQTGLSNFYENVHRPETFGLIGGVAQGAGKALGNYATSKIPGLG